MRAPASDRHPWQAQVLAGLLATVVMAVGCGASDGRAKAGYIKQGNRICADGSPAIAAVARGLALAQRGSDPDRIFRRLADLTGEAVAARRTVVDRLGALPAPAGDQDELKAWLADQRRGQSLREALAAAFARRDDAAISTLSQRIAALGAKNAAFAIRYGLRACAGAVG